MSCCILDNISGQKKTEWKQVWLLNHANDQINTTEKLFEAVSFPKPAIDVVSDDQALIPDRPPAGKTKAPTHLTQVATDVSELTTN